MNKSIEKIVWACIGLIYVSNLFIPILEIDAAQYAEMSREMLKTSNWLHLFDNGTDYLDKPPFLIWVSAFSMKIFGISTWAYKLPSIIFAVGAIYSLFKFTSIFYNKETAQKTALLFGSCQAMFLVTNDIKTDTILLSFVITGFWQIASWLYSKNKFGWIWGALCIGGAMLTKGPIGILIFGFGFLPHFIIKKDWKNILRWEHIGMLLIIALTLLPMSIGLYTQFDLHPEKLVNGEYGVSGLHFFYWTQSFGRITGESSWSNDTSFFFLYSNLLWALIPFTLFFVLATGKGIKKLIARDSQTEWISTAAILLTYLSLGISKFQLPHYIYVVLPFICLLITRYFVSIKNYFSHKFRIAQIIHNALLFTAFTLFPLAVFYVFQDMSTWQIVFLMLIYIPFAIIVWLHSKNKLNVFYSSIFIIVCINLILNFVFYPNLIPYQKETNLAPKIKTENIDYSKLAFYKLYILRLSDFLLEADIPKIGKAAIKNYQYIATGENGLKDLKSLNLRYQIIHSDDFFHISRLKIGFLNPNTRNEYTEKYYLVELLD